jgi:ABC-type transport system involved in multi-copper enzyme maturation permease subunit
VLRSGYLLLFSLFLAPVWVNSMVYQQASVALYASRMAEAGRWITLTIVWFQFCAIQLVALVILSTAISDEIYHRTLGVLMTTPINSFQIVMGKLFSRLLQLIILLAISLPLLAIVRVFGGVSWDYVISSLCITLTTAIFVGSLSLFYSILNRRAYVVIILTAVTIGAVFALFPLLIALAWDVFDWNRTVRVETLVTALVNSNPYVSMFFNTALMIEPRAGAGMPFYSWYLQCAIILAASVLILSLSIKMVRRAALRQAVGQSDASPRARRRRGHTTQPARTATRLRRINGSPIIWKELRAPMLRRHKVIAFILISIALILLFFSYALFAAENALDDEGAHMLYVSIFMGTGILFTIVLPSTSITSEKEARSWPLLLATTLSDAHILWAKFIGAVRRTLPAWLFLFGHLLLFVFVGYIHPIAIGQMAILVVSVVGFLSCTGIYFSSRFKRTTTAVIMNFALAAAIWAVVPLLLVITHEVGHVRYRWFEGLAETYFDTNPFVQAVVVIEGTTDTSNPGNFNWLGGGSLDLLESTGWMAFCMLAYLTLGWLFAWRAKRRLRHNVF